MFYSVIKVREKKENLYEGLPFLLLLLILLIISSCGQRQEEKTFSEPAMIPGVLPRELKEINAIFYDLCSPLEARRIFEQIDVVFDPYILNSLENQYKYNSSNKNAINLGIYGADMSYCHLFGQTQEVINYMSTIYRLSEGLGISENIIRQAERIKDGSIYNPDSLFDIASSIYIAADSELRESDRPGAASLILAGGWIEALFIASSFYNDDIRDKNLEEQILAQKYSLDRLIALLSNYQNDDYIARYLLMFRQLKILFDTVEILFDHEDFMIDTANRTIVSSRPEFIYAETRINEIIKLVRLIRNDMIN